MSSRPSGTTQQAAAAIVADILSEEAQAQALVNPEQAQHLAHEANAAAAAADLPQASPGFVHQDDHNAALAEQIMQGIGTVQQPVNPFAQLDPARLTSPTFQQPEEQQPAVSAPPISLEIPAEIKALIDEPDEEETEQDFARTVKARLDELGFDPNEDDERIKLAVEQAVRAERQAAHAEKVRLKSSRSAWEDEARQHLPASAPFLDTIEAKSKRDFMRKAADLHKRNAPLMLAQWQAAEAERQRLAAIERDSQARAWGRPSSGPAGVPATATAQSRAASRQRDNRGLSGRITDMIREGRR